MFSLALRLFSGMLALQAAAPPSGADDAEALVDRFMTAIERRDDSASSMLTDNAMMGAGDVGGPLVVPAIQDLVGMMTDYCRRTGVATRPETLESLGAEAIVVVARYVCITPEDPAGHEVTWNYIIVGGRIAAIYMS